MPIHAGQRLHAFVHGLFAGSDKAEVRRLYHRTKQLFQRHDLVTETGRRYWVGNITHNTLECFDLSPDHPQAERIRKLVSRLFDYDELFSLPVIDWSDKRTIAEWWDMRDTLKRQRSLMEDFETAERQFAQAIVNFLQEVFAAAPVLLHEQQGTDEIAVETHLVHVLANIGAMTDRVVGLFYDEELERLGLYQRLIDQLDRNLITVSGGNPSDPRGFSRAVKKPSASGITDPGELLGSYLQATPLLDFFDQRVSFTLPTAARFEHHHIVAGSGHGKTQTLQYLIGRDLEAVAEGRRTVIVLDSQGDLIRNIGSLQRFAPGGALHERVVIIDPTDVEYPVSLNLFDVGVERLKRYEALERERLTNSILELYDFVLGSLLDAEMTQKQSVIFRYVTRLMLHIPDATIHTLRDLMEPGSEQRFAGDIARLTGIAREFFEKEFPSREFAQTKVQVLRRLWGMLENRTFERMFSHPRSKLDFFAEMNAGKVILINTAKDLLKQQGSEIFGRFFIAMIAQAAQERSTLPEQMRLPTFVYIDEAADYFDQNIGIILSQARKYNVGMILAHQYLGQLDQKLHDAFSANTSIKFAGGVSTKDARSLSGMLRCAPEFIERQGKGSFAVHIRGVTKDAVPLAFPFGFLEEKPRMTESDRRQLRAKMRERYAAHYSEIQEREWVEPEAEREPVANGAAETPHASTKTEDEQKPRRRRRRRRNRTNGSGTDASAEL